MRYFDLHCDTIGECCKCGLSLYENKLHFDLKRASAVGECVQVFAVWIPDELRGKEAVNYFNKVADYFYTELEKTNTLISAYGDKTQTPVKAILAAEGASAAGGTLQGLEELFNKGVRLVTLTWNQKNELASGAFSQGGFTDFGKEFVAYAEELGIILDVSHLNRESFFEFLEISSRPFVASHSNGDIVDNFYAHSRNLTEEQIMAIKNRGGIIGLNFCRDFIETPTKTGLSALCNQIDYFISLGCEKNIAIGSDYDGCIIDDELCGIEKIPEVYNELIKRGYGKELIDDIFYNNALKFFENFGI